VKFAQWLKDKIPPAVGRCRETSPKNPFYNCIGWAAALKTDEWWQHDVGIWPAGAERTPEMRGLVQAFLCIGFEKCDHGDLEDGYEKVALYRGRNGKWSHASRQWPDGTWTSKLGSLWDADHDDPVSLVHYYGMIHCYMRRRLTDVQRQVIEEARSRTGQIADRGHDLGSRGRSRVQRACTAEGPPHAHNQEETQCEGALAGR